MAGRACSRGPVRWWCSVVVSHVSKPLQSNGKQTTPKTAKDIFFIVFLFYCDMKTKAKKQIKFCYIYKVSKKNAKNIKKNLQVHFFVVSLQQKQKTKTP